MPSPPEPEKRLSDIVYDWKIETRMDKSYITHTFYERGTSAQERHVRKEEVWERKQKLGKGAYGTVYLEEHAQGTLQKTRATKKIKKSIIANENLDYIRELEAIIKFSHPKYSHWFIRSTGWFENDTSIYIIMEYLEKGDLDKHLKMRESPLPEPEARQITIQILEGLDFMHTNGFAHRDIKPQNILVVDSGPHWFVKITDFGTSKRRQNNTMSLTLQRGTIGFAAPEVLGFNHFTDSADDSDEESAKLRSSIHSADMWSLGVTAYLMLTESLFLDGKAGSMFEYVIGRRRFPSELLQTYQVSNQGQEFIHQLMSPNPKDRPTATQAAGHEWCSIPLAENWDAQVINNTQDQSPESSIELTSVSMASKAWSDDEATETRSLKSRRRARSPNKLSETEAEETPGPRPSKISRWSRFVTWLTTGTAEPTTEQERRTKSLSHGLGGNSDVSDFDSSSDSSWEPPKPPPRWVFNDTRYHREPLTDSEKSEDEKIQKQQKRERREKYLQMRRSGQIKPPTELERHSASPSHDLPANDNDSDDVSDNISNNDSDRPVASNHLEVALEFFASEDLWE